MRRQTALTALLITAVLLSAVVLWDVLLVVFFALTVAYVVRPAYEWLRCRGIQRYLASALTTTAVFVVALALSAPLVLVLYLRRGSILDAVQGLPEQLELSVPVAEYDSVVVEASEVWAFLGDQLQAWGRAFVGSAPVLLLQFMLFTVVVFGVLLGWGRAASAVRAVVPREYHDVLAALDERIVDTLTAIYLVQVAAAVTTFLVAIPVFYGLGYEFYLTLAVLCGVLQFMPIVGPSVVIFGLGAFHVATGEVSAGITVVVLAGLLVGLLPDMVVRPYLAGSLARVPATLYFVGFFGGVLTVGVLGAIAGPLALAVLVEAVSLLAAELRSGREGQARLGE